MGSLADGHVSRLRTHQGTRGIRAAQQRSARRPHRSVRPRRGVLVPWRASPRRRAESGEGRRQFASGSSRRSGCFPTLKCSPAPSSSRAAHGEPGSPRASTCSPPSPMARPIATRACSCSNCAGAASTRTACSRTPNSSPAAYVITRPLGASIADWFGKPHAATGLGLGDGAFSAVAFVVFVMLVGYVGLTKPDIQPDLTASERRGVPQPAGT